MTRAAIAVEMVLGLLHGNFYGLFGWVVINPATDRGKSDGVDAIAAGKGKALTVTAGEQFGLTEIAVPPHGAYGVVNKFYREMETRRSTYFSYGATTELTAGLL